MIHPKHFNNFEIKAQSFFPLLPISHSESPWKKTEQRDEREKKEADPRISITLSRERLCLFTTAADERPQAILLLRKGDLAPQLALTVFEAILRGCRGQGSLAVSHPAPLYL